MTTAEYEYMAERFRRDTGLMAPGKSVAPEMAQDNDDERREKWNHWLSSAPGYATRGAFVERQRVVDDVVAILQQARAGEIDQDWRSVIYRVEDLRGGA